MAETGAGQNKGRALAARLSRNRWLLGAGVVAVLAVYFFAGASVYVLLMALAALAAAAMLPADAGRQPADTGAAIEASGPAVVLP